MAEHAPTYQQNVVNKMEQDKEAGGNGFVSSQSDECHGEHDELSTIFRNFADDMDFPGLALVQYNSVVVSADDVAECVECHHFPISATEYWAV